MSPRPAPDPDSLVFCGLAFPEARCGETKVLPLAITNRSGVAAPLAITAPSGITIDGAAPSIAAGATLALVVTAAETASGTIGLRLGGGREHPRHRPRRDQRFRARGAARRARARRRDGEHQDDGRGAGDPISVAAALAVDEPVCGGLPSLVLEGQRTPSEIFVSPTTIEAARRPRRGVCAERPRRSERHVPHEPSQPRDPREAGPGPVQRRVGGALPPIEVDVR